MANHLENESSPYLQQHKNNPVDWYPWGAEALEKAQREDKPILLSIGYAACHWCHVMEHESFENKETAALMNELFVNIKVDREERPDLDKVYQSAHYLLSQRSGGWPLTVFLTPGDLVPFFSGTYFPPESRYQLPAFTDILLGVAGAYKNNRAGIEKQNQELLGFLQHTQSKETAPVLNGEPISRAIQVFEQHYDHTNGGFGGAPKFPQPSRLDFLLHTAPQMSFDTLQHMQQGGIYDQLGGGFFRYSVDNQWRIPHFEKMLYDNGQLLYLYSFVDKEIARDTAEWLINTMQSAEGGYYSSIDADSEGHEGKFYVWDKEEVKSVLTADEYALVSKHYGLDLPANFESKWHLYIAAPVPSGAEATLQSAREKLLAVRNQRVAPFIDKKILVAWNALAIKGMLSAGSKLQEQRFIDSADLAIQLIQKKLWVNHRLFASYKDQKAYLAAYLDDYAFLLDALITTLQINWNSEYLYFAIEVADTLIEQFFDKENGAFYFTANDHETLLYRPKTMADEALPSGNGVAARVLLVLGHLLGETRYLDAAEKTLQAAAPFIREYPSEHTSLLLALKEYLLPSQIIVMRGEREELQRWQASVSSSNNYVFAILVTANLPEALAAKKARDKVCAYVCQGTQCLDVIDDIETLERVKK